MCLCACQTSDSKIKTEDVITASETAIAKGLVQGVFDDVWGGLDSTKISDYHTDDFVILEQGSIWTNQEIKAYINKSLSNPNDVNRINRMEYIDIQKYGNAMNMAYHNYATFMRGDTIVGRAQWLESALAVDTDEGWRLKMMHSTWVPLQE